ncbi:MAG: hypothetical protein WA364_16920 [Candidatus Nitrosopolaris sp.]
MAFPRKNQNPSVKDVEMVKGPVSGSCAIFSYNSPVLLSMTHSILRIDRDVTFKNTDQQALQ